MGKGEKMKRKDYEEELEKLHVQLVYLQEWVKNIISHLLSKIDYEAPPRTKIVLPKRQERGKYREPDYPYKYIPEKF